MAESAPINDVLCGAVEYLVKLGTNLRQRSEILKHKRIRKDRLRNTHAVQKAASKVLLLCELSKKSIRTVEASVETIVSQIASLQGNTNGGKSSSPENVAQYEYFMYNSKRLKIRNKVNIKHYTSAKVVASVMSTSMQDRYPVFYDCKLYRLRMKALSHNSKTNVSERENDTSNESSSKTNISSDKKNDLERLNKKEKTVKFNDSIVICDEHIDNTKWNVSNGNKREEDRKNTYKDDKSSRAIVSENKDKNFRKRSTSQDVKDDKKDTNASTETRKTYSQKIKKFKHIKLIIDDSSSDSIKTSDSKSVDGVENSLEESSVENGTSKEVRKPSEITKTPIFLNRSDSNSNVEEDKTEENESNTEGPKGESSSIENASTIIVSDKSFDNKDDNEEMQSEPNTNNYESDKSVESNSSKKSFIKCVSITKLLKPDKIATLTSRQVNNDNECSKKSKTKIKSKDRLTERIQCSTSTSDSIIDMKNKDDEYWQQKRKEVKYFKAKKFTINITRLPKLTDKYLESQNLKRIVQNESVICEVTLIPNRSHCESHGNQSSIMTGEDHTKDMIAIKNYLLNASDSEQTDEDIRQVNEIVKKSLLCESDSGKEDSNESVKKVDIKNDNIPPDPRKSSPNENTINSDEEISDTIENKVDNVTTHGSNEKSKCIERQSKEKELNVSNETNNKVSDLTESHRILRTPDITTELTKDQDDLLLENIKTPDNKQQSVDSPKSKRKRIMENMHAKKMLLTYSSSSDTEDEHLTNTLKQIKNDLLKVDANSKDDKSSTSSSESASSNNSMKSKESLKSHSKSKRKKISPAKDDNEPEDNSNSTSSKMDHSNGKSSSGDQHSNSEDSDKDINGLTNLKTLRKSRRQRSEDRSRWHRFRMAKMPKVPVLSEEALLQPDSGSDVASVASNEDCEVEELPRVPVMALNGDGDTLAKDDLLADSDSSTSQNQNKTSQDDKEGDSEEENLKAKRRKANAIASSDSEAGSSRRKDRRISDFEDSEDDGLDTDKKSKRKKNRSESDSGSNDEGKKKRRRIKNIDDSEGSGSETENEGRNKHGRKNIRKVMGKNQLEEATKKAAREEKERIARIAERQKLYNNLQFDESGKPDEVVLDKVVLDFDPETKEPIIELDKGLVKKLKPHQANGIKFMWDACFESVKRIKKGKGSGCILAHCMGLGKTLQVVSLTHTLLTHSALTGVSRVLVVCPLSTVLNWVNEFKMWLKHTDADYEVDVYELSRFKQNSDRAFQLSQWFQHGGVCVLGYEMFRNLSSDSNKKFKKKMLKNFQEALVDPGPDLVVCDEGHLLKNEKTSLSQAMNKVKTLRRIVLTGTPLQNNLKEYYCMVQFVKPNLLGKYNEYLNRFVNPITNGQYTDSTEHDIKIMKRRSHVLHKMLDGAVQRRDYGVLAPFLPPKHEYVLFITLTEVQIKLYTHYLDNYSRRPLPGKSSGFLFPDFQSLQRIWTHPLVLKYNSERYEIMQQKKREREEEDSEGSLVDFIDDDSTPEESTSEESTDDSSDMSDDSRKKSKKKKSPKKSKGRSTRRGTRANPVEVLEDDDVQEVVEVKNENPTEWWMSLVNEEELDDVRNSHKLVLLFDILRQCEAIGDKLLVFSQSLYSLDLIEHFLGKVDEATQEGRVDEKLGGHVGSWSPGIDYFRLDGSTSCENRSIWCKNFNREDNPRARLFLISTRAGGLGINLVAANRVVIFDVSWNPSHDVQSIFRVYRFGQKKPCYIYRFLVMGTMEEKIYERQVTKQAISKRVIDEQQIDRHYAENDLAELYKFEPEPPQPRPIPPLPKDRLFAEMLKEHEQLIYKYHEHDSLLENKEEETLTEEERKAAWEDFENEKTRPPPVPFTSPYAMHNGMMPGLLAQQQQIAYATVAAMLRKEAPTITENQIRDMMPLIYSANPQLMQKMSEMYKYPQSGMVNPGMMNAVMNPGGGGMPMGGSSGLQYEPPWQRQQQMRLQQLMQQQNQMGAKYYAGGLGSRDPVAMALQHQRAREMMLGERSRPRGRPPLHATDAPSRPAPQDVVNLDSD